MYKPPTVEHRNAVSQNFAQINIMRSEARLTNQNISRSRCNHTFQLSQFSKKTSATKFFGNFMHFFCILNIFSLCTVLICTIFFMNTKIKE